MAFITIPVAALGPAPMYDNATAITNQFVATMSVSGAMVGVIILAPKAGSITDITWGTRTVTTGATVGVDVQGVDLTTGFPDGVSLGAAGSQVVGNADDNVFFTTALGSSATVTKGQLIAVVVSNAGSGNMQAITTASLGVNPISSYCVSHNGTSWSKVTGQPMVGLRYSDGSYSSMFPAVWGPGTVTNNDMTTATTPDVAGLRFRTSIALRVAGAWGVLQGTGELAMRLVTTAYNQGAGTGILASVTQDPDVRRAANACLYWLLFPSSVELSANTYYRLVAEPTQAVTVRLHSINMGSSALLGCYNGTEFEYTSAKDPTGDGSWTQANNYPMMGLLVDGVESTSGGSDLAWGFVTETGRRR